MSLLLSLSFLLRLVIPQRIFLAFRIWQIERTGLFERNLTPLKDSRFLDKDIGEERHI